MEQLLLINPRAIPPRRHQRRHAVSAGPKHLGNLPPGLRRYWMQKRRGKRLANPRRPGAHMAKSRRRHHRTHHLTSHQRRVRAGRKAARTRAKRYGRRHYFSRKRRASGADFGINPRRTYRRLKNPRRLSNPFAGFGTVRGVTKLGTGAVIGAGGAVALDYLWQWGSGYLPASWNSGYLGTAAKAAVALLAGWGVSKVAGKPVAIAMSGGALTVIAYQLIHQLIATNAPQASIPATTTTATPALPGMHGMNAYMTGRGMGALAWTSPGSQLRGLRAYMPGRGAPMAPNVNRPGGSVNPSGLAMAGTY